MKYICFDVRAYKKCENKPILMQNYAQKLFIAFKMTISCCFCLRGNLYFPDFLQNKFYNINYRYPLQALTTWTVNARSWWSIWSTVKDWFKPFLTKLRLNLYFLIGRFRLKACPRPIGLMLRGVNTYWRKRGPVSWWNGNNDFHLYLAYIQPETIWIWRVIFLIVLL